MGLPQVSPQATTQSVTVEDAILSHLTYAQIMDLMVKAFRLEYLADVRQNMIGFDLEAFYRRRHVPGAIKSNVNRGKYPWRTVEIGASFPIPAQASHLAYSANTKYAPRKFAVKRDGYKYLVERVA